MAELGSLIGAVEELHVNPPKRPWCQECDRPKRVCLCSSLPRPRIASKVHIIVLMHPKELERKVTTVRHCVVFALADPTLSTLFSDPTT